MKKNSARATAHRPVVVGTGLIALDEVTIANQSVPARYWAGGTCGNVLIALRYLGWNAQPIARLANDRATKLVLNDLRHWGVSERFIRVDEDGSTPIIVHRITKDTHGRVKHSFSWRCSTCGARYPSYKPELLGVAEEIVPTIKNVQLFFFDRLSAGAIELAKGAAERGAIVVFEPSGLGNPILFGQAWKLAHIVKYSHERLSEFPEVDADNRPRLLIETLGAEGLRYRWRDSASQSTTRWIDSKALMVDDVKDTAGAGDWCTAGLLSKVATGGYAHFAKSSRQQIAEAIKFGQALAAWNCRFEGARGGMYAASKREFDAQVDEILSGSKSALSLKKGAPKATPSRSTICRVCDHSKARIIYKRRRAR